MEEVDNDTPTPLLDSDLNSHTDKYPMCIVWSPIPFLTWILPFVGHLGITTSDGEINDFAASYFIHVCAFSESMDHLTSYSEKQ